MHLSRFQQRSVLGLLVVFALCGGWFLRGLQLFQNAHAGAANTFITSTRVPVTSNLEVTPSIDSLLSKYSATTMARLLRLTSGLRPGPGQPIPNVSDVTILPVMDVSFYNWRGELLSGWLSLTSPEAPVIILTHGTPGNRVSMLSRAAFLHNHGYNVLLFDFQSYGRSQGEISTLGMVESEDILAAISYLRSLPATMYSKIGVLGLSMGATAAVLAAARSDDILAVVAESCPVDATRVLADVPNEESREADQQLVEEIYGVDITQARPIDVVNRLAGRTSIFFINGNADDITPLSGMYELYDAASFPKEYWVVAGAGHAESFAVDPDDYMQKVNAFFDTYLQ